MSESKKTIVLAISHSFCANFIRGQAKFLQDNGFKVLIVSADGEEVRSVAKNEMAELIIVNFAREISPVRDFISLIKVVKILNKVKPDIVNAGNPKSGLLFMIACCFFPRIRAIFTLRGLRSDTLKGFKRHLVLLMEWLSCKLSEKTIVISPSLRDYAVKAKIVSSEKAVVIGNGSSNGVNLLRFTPNDQNIKASEDFRKHLGIGKNDFVIGFAGRITKDKGIEDLYNSFKILKKSFTNIKLVITGPVELDDPVKPSIMAEIKSDNLVFMPGKSTSMPTVLLSYDVLVLPSHREGFGNVALEASSMGKAVIVSNIPGCKDTVQHGYTGFLANVNDPNDLAEKLSKYLLDSELCKVHGINGRIRVEKLFASHIIWRGQLELYNELLKFKK